MNRRNIVQTAAAAVLSALGLAGQSRQASAAARGLLEVRAVPGMGRGVFARTPIRAGTIVLRDYTIPVSAAEEENAAKTVFHDYYFVSESSAEDGAIAYLAVGLASLINHSNRAPNVDHDWDLTKEGWVVEFTALRNIRAGEQLFFDYDFDENEIPSWADNPRK